jgi:hypothetical protein
MKAFTMAALLILPTLTQAQDVFMMMEKATFLETAKGRPEEAMKIHQQIAATPPTEETRATILRALDATLKHQQEKLREESSFQQKMDRFIMHPKPERHVIDLFGTPERNDPYYKSAILNKRELVYEQGLTIRVDGYSTSITFNKPIHSVCGIGVGNTEKELTATFPPKETRIYDKEKQLKEGAGYTLYGALYDKTNKKGGKWYPVNKELSFSLKDGRVESFTISIQRFQHN